MCFLAIPVTLETCPFRSFVHLDVTVSAMPQQDSGGKLQKPLGVSVNKTEEPDGKNPAKNPSWLRNWAVDIVREVD